jgi:hypothetical protein
MRTPRSPFCSSPSTRPLIRSTPPVKVSGNAVTPHEPPASSLALAQTPDAQIALTDHSEKHGAGLPGGAMTLGASNPNLLIFNESPQVDTGPWMSNSGPLAWSLESGAQPELPLRLRLHFCRLQGGATRQATMKT